MGTRGQLCKKKNKENAQKIISGKHEKKEKLITEVTLHYPGLSHDFNCVNRFITSGQAHLS